MAKYRLRHGEWFILIALTLLQAAWIADLSPGTAYAQSVPTPSAGLFTAVSAQSDATLDTRPTIVRSRVVEVNFDGLGKVNNVADVQRDTANFVTLNLFSDVTLTAQRDRVERWHSPTGFIWEGHVQGADHSQVTLIFDNGVLVGNIRIGLDQDYQVRYAGNGHHVIYQIDQTMFPDEMHETDKIPDPADLSQPLSPDAMTDDGSTIDIMVVYTADALTEAGSQTAMNNLITLAITDTNQAYQNSGIAQRVRLVHSAQVTYTESGDIQTDLNRLTNKTDGFMDNVHSLRDTSGADLVALLTHNGGGFCGIAWLMTNVSTAFENSGFSVVALNCAIGNHSFAHELGHNMSARHDWFVDPTNNSPYTYNHGYYPPTNAWRTIMAYADGCGGCTRIQYFSNPDVTFNGLPMGRPEGQTNAADNRKTLNNTAFTVANFRQTVGGPPSITSPAPGSTLTSSTVTFTGGHTGADLQHWLYVGTTQGGASLFNQDLGTGHTATVSGLPTSGTIWVRYWTRFSSGWQFTDQAYTMNVTPAAPPITSPVPGSTLTSSTVTFTGGHTGADLQHWLYVGTTQGGASLFNQDLGTGHTATVSGLPTSGTIWVRYWTRFSSGWVFTDQAYTMNVTAAPPITSPVPGSTLTSSTVTFTGGHTGADLQHWLYVGTTQGGASLFNQDLGTGHTATVSGLPNTGTIWVRYWTRFSSGWQFTDQSYTMNVTATAPPITSPAPGSTLTSSTVTFTGGHTSADLQHWLYVGTTQGGATLFNQDLGTGHTATVSGLPSSSTIWVRYWTRFSSGWQFTDQSYTRP